MAFNLAMLAFFLVRKQKAPKHYRQCLTNLKPSLINWRENITWSRNCGWYRYQLDHDGSYWRIRYKWSIQSGFNRNTDQWKMEARWMIIHYVSNLLKVDWSSNLNNSRAVCFSNRNSDYKSLKIQDNSQRYTYWVLQTIQMKPMFLCVWQSYINQVL